MYVKPPASLDSVTMCVCRGTGVCFSGQMSVQHGRYDAAVFVDDVCMISAFVHFSSIHEDECCF